MDLTGLIAVGAAVVGVLVAGAGLVVAFYHSGARMVKRLDALNERVFKLQDDSLGCQKREAELKAELVLAVSRIRALENATGAAPPAPLSGIIVADLRGLVREYSPALTPILNYLPREVIGRPIDMLVPDDLKEQQRAAFARMTLDPEAIDPVKEVLTHGLAKGGARVPIAITLHGWKAGTEGLITATIRQRAKAPDA